MINRYNFLTLIILAIIGINSCKEDAQKVEYKILQVVNTGQSETYIEHYNYSCLLYTSPSPRDRG